MGVLGILCCFSAIAQQPNTTIKGRVVDNESAIVASATIYLLRAGDSSLVKLALTNDQGFFVFENLKPSTYLLNISNTRYRKSLLKPINVSYNSITDVGTIELKNGNELKEVDITEKIGYVDVKPGKVILNVSKSILSAGGTALDILSSAPGVQISDNGTIKLRGKDVLIMLNSKQVYLSPDALTEFLRNIPNTMIGQIELISNPNASYAAEGSGGIINIKMQRNKAAGISGLINTGFGVTDINSQYGTRHKWSSGFNLDYNNKNLSLFGGYTHTDNLAERLSITDRSIYDPLIQQIHTDYLNDLNDRGNSFRFGVDYNLTPKHLIGFLVNGLYSNYDYNKNTTTNILNNGIIDSSIISRSVIVRKLLTYTVNLNYKGDLGKFGDLSVDADYSIFDRKPTEDIYSDYYYPNNVLYRTSILENIFPTLYRIYTLSVNNEVKLGKNSTIQAVVKASYVTNDNTSNFGYFNNQVYQPDPLFAGQFNYKEHINAFGLTYSTILNKKTNIEVGLRTEQTITNGQATSVTNVQQVTTNNYVDFFPSLQLTSNLNNNDQLSFSYGRRVKRPLYTDLNPFLNYQDQYNYYIGNPGLKPQYTNNIEITNIYKQKFSATLQASVINNYTYVTFLPGNIITQKVNFGNNYSYGVQLNETLNLTKWWDANLNLDAAEEYYNNSDLNGTSYNIHTQAITFNLQQQFSFLKKYKAEIFTLYESPTFEGFYYYDSKYRVNTAISKSIIKNKGSVQLQVFDVFNSYYNNYHTNYQNLNYNGHAQIMFRTIQLNFIYAIGNKTAKAERQHKMGSSDEQSRAGG